MKPLRYLIILALLAGSLSACLTAPPDHPENICKIFTQYPKWYWRAKKTEHKWGTPIATQMAIIYQESHFIADARPARGHILWIIPWFRPSSAYGYSQALTQTWQLYTRQTGHSSADRDTFADASDFIGWFAHRAYRQCQIPRNNARLLYLAYHEGLHGYRDKTYQQKPWLIQVASKVQKHAWTFNWELKHCINSIPKKPWYDFWD